MNTFQYHIDPTPSIKHTISNLNFFDKWEEECKNTKLTTIANTNTQINSANCGCAKTNILAIDDEEICLASIEIILHNTNCSLMKASNGKIGLEILKNNPDNIDLIFLDLMMPDLHGIEVLKIIKDNPSLEQIPVILQTGSANELDIQEALNIGAVECIRKPYTRNTILASISRNLGIK